MTTARRTFDARRARTRLRARWEVARRPVRLLSCAWRDLVFLNYDVDPRVLAPLLPRHTELDLRGGRALLSLVAFRFLDLRVGGIALPYHQDLDGVNLRFYVRRRTANGWRRGVVFVKEVAPRRAIAWIARAIFGEPYVTLPVRHEIVPASGTKASRRASYSWLHERRWNVATVETAGASFLPDEDSEEAFVTQRHWGYARQADGGTVEYQVEHPNWRCWRAATAELECDVAGFYGAELVPYLTRPPAFALLAEGSLVAGRRGVRL